MLILVVFSLEGAMFRAVGELNGLLRQQEGV